MSRQARDRLRKPLRRGRFQPIDGARAGLAPVSVADNLGQARVYYLVDADTHVIEDARFLAFGSLASHPLADLWCDTVRGMTLEAAGDVTADSIEAALRDEPDHPAIAEADKHSRFFWRKSPNKAPLYWTFGRATTTGRGTTLRTQTRARLDRC